MKKWFEGMEKKQVIEVLESIQQSVKIEKVEYKQEALFADFVYKYTEVRTVIVNIRTEYYMYNKEVYNNWTDALIAIDTMKKELEEYLVKVYFSGQLVR
jgi:hypothetical protein